MGEISWPSGTPDTRDSNWLEVCRNKIIDKMITVKFTPNETVLFPINENIDNGLMLRTDILKGYMSDVLIALTRYVNHTIVPDDPTDIPQVVNPCWTIHTIMDEIGVDALPDPQYEVIDNDLWLLTMKKILDLLIWPRIPGVNDPSTTVLDSALLSWNSYSYSCESIMSCGVHQRITPPSQTVARCLGWEYGNSGYARHTDEYGNWEIDLDEVFSSGSGIRCPPCVAANGDWGGFHHPCEWNIDERSTLWCPEYVSPTFGAGYLKTGVIWNCTQNTGGGWSKTGNKYCSPNGSGTSASVTISKPVIHPEIIPDGLSVLVFLEFTKDGEKVRNSLGRYERVENDSGQEIVYELPNPFGEFESIELPSNPAKFSSNSLAITQEVDVICLWITKES